MTLLFADLCAIFTPYRWMIEHVTTKRGQLRIYLGAAPGVGKTYAMLGEAHRRLERGTDVVAAVVETHGRNKTAKLLEGIEMIPPRYVEYRGARFPELDVEAVLRRHPQVVLVDELAHTNTPGSKNPKRWQDVQEILDAGITVISTVNIQHLEGLNDVVEQITGIEQKEKIPDEIVRAADQVELVDITPEALRRRLAHGNVYAAERVDAALSNYFRTGNLTALREIALLWLADQVDAALEKYRADKKITATWEARERVVVAIFTGPLLLARTPALHGVGTAGLGVFVALAASLTVLPALIALAGASRQLPAPTTGAGWTGRLSLPVSSASALGTAAVLAICMLPIIGMRWGVAENPTRQGGAQVLPGNALPDVVVIKSARDLRDPAALIAINQVSHRLVEVPGVRKVESAAWPAGVPWTDASLSSAAGRLADQLGQQAGSFVPAVTAIKSMKSIIEQMSGAVDQLDSTVNVTLAGARQAQQYLDPMLAAARNLKNKTTELSEYLETIHTWIVGFTNCPDDVLCTAMRKVIEPYDIVVTGMNELSTGADRISAISTQTMSALSSAPRMVAQMRSALAQVRSFVPKLETTIQDAMPQIAQASAMLKNLSADFADTGEGGFHLSRKDLADPSYRHVRESMFSSDGTATRLFLYSDGQLDLAAAARAQQLEIAAGKAMKYGSLVDSQVTVGGAAQIAAAVRDALIHDAVLLAVILLTVVALASMWRGAVHGAAVGVGVLASYLAALGVSIALWQHLLDRELNALVPLVSFAVLASCGVPYLVAGIKAGRIADEATGARSKGAVSGRGAVAPLAALGGVFGAGLVLVSGGSFSVLSQIGTVVVLGLGVLITVQRAWLPTTPGRR